MGLWIVNADGSGLRRLRAGRGATEGIHPSWSPDGRWIVFGWTGRSPHPWGRLAAVRPDGSVRVLVKPRAGKHDDELTFPAWSRDGRRLAYVRIDHRLGRAGRTGSRSPTRVANTDACSCACLTTPVSKGAPTWSPNGRLLAYWGVCGQGICVSTVPSRGGRPRVLLGSYAEPAWGPAGT